MTGEPNNTNSQEPKVERFSAHGGHLITVSGVIDERFSRKSLADGLPGVVVIDMDKVFRITSFGVREWRRAISSMASSEYYFVKCRPSIIAQFNMVDRFGGNGRLLSFYAPYLCPSCGKEFEQLVDLRFDSERVKSLTPPDARCPQCQTPAELDDIASDYFSYPASLPPVDPPALVDALLKGVAASKPQFRVEKKVSERTTTLSLFGVLDSTTRLRRPFDGLEGNVVVFTEHISEVTTDGLQLLKEVLDTQGPNYYLARVSFALAHALQENISWAGRASIVSLWLSMWCDSCKRANSRELDAVGMRSLREGLGGPPCHDCGATTRIEKAEELKQLGGFRLAAWPPEVFGAMSQSEAPAAAQGRQMIGRYELLRRIGAGGMAEVFLAVHRGVGDIEKRVVIKRLLPHLAADPQLVSMLLQEARLAARIQHPNVVQTFDVGQADQSYYIAMELVRGWDLNTLLRLSVALKRPIPMGVVCRIVADMCAGLHAAHTCTDEEGRSISIIHRDVSPHNVLLTQDGIIKITDFGIAKAADGFNSSLTPTTSLKGKLSYVAPEQVNVALGPTDARSDVFACGVVLVQLMTLEHPFRRPSELATMKAILNDPIPDLKSARPEVPSLLEQVAAKSLERSLDRRYKDAAGMRLELEQVLRGLGQPTTAVEVAMWMQGLTQEASSVGELPEEAGVTPTAQRQPIPPIAQLSADEVTPPLRAG